MQIIYTLIIIPSWTMCPGKIKLNGISLGIFAISWNVGCEISVLVSLLLSLGNDFPLLGPS